MAGAVRLALPAVEEDFLVVFGDSLFAMAADKDEALLCASRAAPCANAGSGYDTFRTAFGRAWMVCGARPGLIYVLFGTNDLLQGASVVDWRVGGAPPVPIGMQAGIGVVMTGEVVGFRMLPALDHNAVQMLRFDATRVHRGTFEGEDDEGVQMSCFGESECARYLMGGTTRRDDASELSTNRWRARVPTRTVFIPAKRISAVMGVAGGIIVDDLRPSIEPYSNRVPTPHLEALARRGTVFDRAYANEAVCAPSPQQRGHLPPVCVCACVAASLR